MSVLPITTYPKAILKKKTEEVRSIDADIKKLIARMIEAMYANKGIGLAAPQIGISKQLIIVETSDNPRFTVREEISNGKPLAFLNPRIIKASKERETGEEGCLSLPGIFLQVKRATQVEVHCKTPDGKEVQIQASGLTARIFQHEIDHINGTLIINRVSPFARLKIKKQLDAMKKIGGTR